MTKVLLTVTEMPISGPHPNILDIVNDESVPDGSYLYRVTHEWWNRS